jgi:1,4-dihydroxy-2-naphthoyl-CoA hydrolase
MILTLFQLNAIVDSGFNGALGLRVTASDAAAAGTMTAEWTLAASHLDAHGDLHHGATSAVIETVASIAGMTVTSDPNAAVVGVSNNTDYGEPGCRSPLRVHATNLLKDAQQQLWDVEITDASGISVARGRVRLQVLSREGERTHSGNDAAGTPRTRDWRHRSSAT